MNEQYKAQVEILLTVLPIVAREEYFALKGGTAINFFYQDFPRLSVDIDLTYLPIQPRDQTLQEIEQSLFRIRDAITKELKLFVKEQRSPKLKMVTKLLVSKDYTEIKIEPNLIMRGGVYSSKRMDLSLSISQEFEKNAYQVPIMSKEDVYAGKICAALDRQHPRDLFDVGYLLNGNFTDKIKNAFLVYLICNNRPIHELLNPNLIDIKAAYESEFLGMTDENIPLNNLFQNRTDLIRLINESLTTKDKDFLLSIKKGTPDFSLHEVQNLEQLPAIKWKLFNINKMDKSKHRKQLQKLENLLFGGK